MSGSNKISAPIGRYPAAWKVPRIRDPFERDRRRARKRVRDAEQVDGLRDPIRAIHQGGQEPRIERRGQRVAIERRPGSREPTEDPHR
jgi:hypothetical protein